jgi:hypothetical protein
MLKNGIQMHLYPKMRRASDKEDVSVFGLPMQKILGLFLFLEKKKKQFFNC